MAFFSTFSAYLSVRRISILSFDAGEVVNRRLLRVVDQRETLKAIVVIATILIVCKQTQWIGRATHREQTRGWKTESDKRNEHVREDRWHQAAARRSMKVDVRNFVPNGEERAERSLESSFGYN